MWIVVVAILGGLAAAALLLLSLPLELVWHFEFYGQPKFNLQLTWCFGLISHETKTGRRKPRISPKIKTKEKFSVRKLVNSLKTASEFLRIKGLKNQVLRFLRRLLRCFQIRNLESEVTVGLDDPEETFYLFALTEPLNWWINSVQPHPVYIRPSFIEPIIEGYFRGEVRLYPVRLMPPVILFLFSLPTFQVIRKAVALRWRRNR